MEEWSARRRPLPDNTQYAQHTDIHAPVGFEPTISTGESPQTFVLDRAATETGTELYLESTNMTLNMKLYTSRSTKHRRNG